MTRGQGCRDAAMTPLQSIAGQLAAAETLCGRRAQGVDGMAESRGKSRGLSRKPRNSWDSLPSVLRTPSCLPAGKGII